MSLQVLDTSGWIANEGTCIYPRTINYRLLWRKESCLQPMFFCALFPLYNEFWITPKWQQLSQRYAGDTSYHGRITKQIVMLTSRKSNPHSINGSLARQKKFQANHGYLRSGVYPLPRWTLSGGVKYVLVVAALPCALLCMDYHLIYKGTSLDSTG